MARDEFDDQLDDEDAPAPRRRRDRDEDVDDRPPRKKGMSGGMQVLIILLCIGGALFLLCCGGIFFLGYSFTPEMVNDPARVDAIRSEIADMSIPADFKGVQAIKMSNPMMAMRTVEYANPAADGKLVMVEMQVKIGDANQNQAQMRQQMQAQGMAEDVPLQNSKSETKSLSVKGEQRDFEFSQGEAVGTKEKRRRVEGTFRGKNGEAKLVYTIDEAQYNEDEVTKMIEGIN